ncbi:MAG TPA: hypothetical protein VD998_04020 [Verrucomicrobiae bacterium]|nr:hypothetical protein [Verrucomicrobiae bacterium]
MDREVFVRTFYSFNVGFHELIRLCRPAADSYAAALQCSVPLAVAVNYSFGDLVEFALAERARQASFAGSMELANKRVSGFSYRTASNCIFGWIEVGQGKYNFFVRVDRFWIRHHRFELRQKLTQANWLGCDRWHAQQFISNLHLL